MSWYKSRLYAPGPVEVASEVLAATARPVIHHRTPEFTELFKRVRACLAELACVPGEDVLILAGSGTAAFEAGFLACVPRGAKLIGINAGKFGERWVKLARKYGHEVVEYKLEWGEVAKPVRLVELLEEHPNTYAVMSTHSETSTGALHDIEALGRVIRDSAPHALFLVDAVTSLGVAELCPNDWHLDGMFSGSQKGLMLPPGLAFAWLSERAWARGEEHSETLHPSFYLDLHKERVSQRKGQSAQTPAVNLIYGLELALDMLLNEGLESVWRRRERQTRAIIAAAETAGCSAYAERISPAVAALRAPDGIAAPDIVAAFAKRGVRVAGGQDDAKPVLFRPATLGYADQYDAVLLCAVLEDALRDVGVEVATGAALSAALKVLNEG